LEFARIKAAGATAVRIDAQWNLIAPTYPGIGDEAKDPSNPSYHWSDLDQAVKQAKAQGLDPIVGVFATPNWAGAVQPPPRFGPSVPRLDDWRNFASAIALRYSGSYGDLPRVRYWRVWNEPNLLWYLSPQFVSGVPAAPRLYGQMLNAFSQAVHRVRPDNEVIAGSLSPFTFHDSIAPLRFMRNLLCMSKSAHPRPTCRSAVTFDIWSHHPYTSGGPGHHASNPDDVSLGDLPQMRRLLLAAYEAGHIRSHGPPPFWVTEFSWDSKPPDPYAVPAALEARWVAQALYNMWRSGVSLVCWFVIRDFDLDSPWQSGLYFLGGNPTVPDWPKPALTAFRFPFVALRAGGDISIWGRTPSSRAARVTLEVKSIDGWRRIAFLRSQPNGIFSTKLAWARVAKLVSGSTRDTVYSQVIRASHPSSYWRLDDPRGPLARDTVGTSTGHFGGKLIFGAPGALKGQRSRAIRFEGGRVDLGVPAVPSTVELWAKTTSRDDQPAVSFRDSSGMSLVLQLHGDYPRAFDYGYALAGYTRINDGRWHYIVFTHKADRARLYVDGRLEHIQVSWPDERSAGGGYLGYDASMPPLRGVLDEVAFYNYPLSAAQVEEHYVASGRKPVDFGYLRARIRGTRVSSWPFSPRHSRDFYVSPFGGI
jgi:hypothetical protein